MEIPDIELILEKEKENLSNLLPREYQKRFNNNAFICGGCIYSLRNDQEPKDYDFFLIDNVFAEELFEYFKSQEIKPFKNLLQGKYKKLQLTISKYAITVGKYQIIVKFVGQPTDVVNQFDFKHNMFYYYNNKINNAVDWEYLDTNKISFNEGRTRDISGTIMRIPKFVKRGMIVTKKEIAKMLSKLEENGFNEREKEIIQDAVTY